MIGRLLSKYKMRLSTYYTKNCGVNASRAYGDECHLCSFCP